MRGSGRGRAAGALPAERPRREAPGGAPGRAARPGLAEIADAARRGDEGAFERLVVETSSDLYALALRLVGNEHDASDVVQETYLRAFRSIGRFRGEAAVSTWLFRIAANCSSNQVRRRARARHSALDDDVAIADTRPDRDPEQAAGASFERARIVAALGELPASLRVVVVLRDVYDLSHEAIATELGISRAAAKVRLHRARRSLRETLHPDGAGEGRSDGGVAVPRPIDGARRAAGGAAAGREGVSRAVV